MKKVDSPFVEVPRFWRVAIVAFVIIYNAFLLGLSEAIHDPSRPLAALRFFTRLLYQGLLIFPFLYYKRGFGWLHPLIFTVVWGLATNVAGSPNTLLDPLRVFFQPLHDQLSSPGLVGYTEWEVAWQVVKANLINSLALVSYYAGFFSGLRPRVPTLNLRVPEEIGTWCSLIVGGVFGGFLLIMQMQGGILTHMASFGLGRFRSLGGLQHIAVFLDISVLASLLWYASGKNVGRNPVFWVVFITSLAMQFAWGGSRSAVIFPMAYLLAIRLFYDRSIPWARIAGTGAIAIVLFGMLGLVRHSTYGGKVPELEALVNLNIVKSVEYAEKRVEERSSGVSNFTAIVGRVPQDVDLLYGWNYLGTLLNFVPRAIWEEKPRGIGSYVTKYLYGTKGEIQLEDSEPKVGGNPPGPTGALYWNFYIPGVVLGWAIFGAFHSWLAHFFRKNYSSLILPVYIIALIAVPGPVSLTTNFRKIALILFLMYFLRIVVTNKRVKIK